MSDGELLEQQIKELRKLRRKDLLEIMLEQSCKIEEQKEVIESQKNEILHLESRLQERQIEINEAGNLADASLKLNGIFDAAQAAARQYLDNLETTSVRCKKMEEDTRKKCDAMKAKTSEECRILLEETKVKCELLEKETKTAVDKQWNELISKLENFYNAHKDLKELLYTVGVIE